MSISDGHDAIISRAVAELTDYSLVLPNGPGKSLPRYVVLEAGGRQRPFGLDGKTEAWPEVLFRVETQAGEYSAEAADMVRALTAVFPRGKRFGGGAYTVLDAPDVRPPLPVANDIYSIPVYVSARMVF